MYTILIQCNPNIITNTPNKTHYATSNLPIRLSEHYSNLTGRRDRTET